MLMQPLVQQVYETVAVNPHLNQSAMMFQADAECGKVILRGTVGSFFEKQMAQEAVREIRGVRQIQNELVVLD